MSDFKLFLIALIGFIVAVAAAIITYKIQNKHHEK